MSSADLPEDKSLKLNNKQSFKCHIYLEAIGSLKAFTIKNLITAFIYEH